MTKATLWFLFSALTAAFLASAVLQMSRAHYEAEERRNGRPSDFYVEIIEPKMRWPHVVYDCEPVERAATPTTFPATRPVQ
jgi:hypothetical protein